MRVEHTTSEPIRPAAGREASRTICGAGQGIAAAGIAAVLFAWFLPPDGSLTVTRLDSRVALALFVLGMLVGSIVVEGNQ
jgi:hypothetical protein